MSSHRRRVWGLYDNKPLTWHGASVVFEQRDPLNAEPVRRQMHLAAPQGVIAIQPAARRPLCADIGPLDILLDAHGHAPRKERSSWS